jgi:hypothetical protein
MNQLKELSPNLSAQLHRCLAPELVVVLEQLFEWCCLQGGLDEKGVKRAAHASFNPKPARLALLALKQLQAHPSNETTIEGNSSRDNNGRANLERLKLVEPLALTLLINVPPQQLKQALTQPSLPLNLLKQESYTQYYQGIRNSFEIAVGLEVVVSLIEDQTKLEQLLLNSSPELLIEQLLSQAKSESENEVKVESEKPFSPFEELALAVLSLDRIRHLHMQPTHTSATCLKLTNFIKILTDCFSKEFRSTQLSKLLNHAIHRYHYCFQ